MQSLNPDLPQYSGKAMVGRAFTFPIAAMLVPAIWWLRYRDRPYPVDVDLLFTAPFVIDLVGNALGLYDSIESWDDASHFFNWMLITAGAALVMRSTGAGRLICFGLAVGFAAVSAIAWELAEYVTFVRFSPELAAAYTDTLGTSRLGTLGGTPGAAIRRAAVAGTAHALTDGSHRRRRAGGADGTDLRHIVLQARGDAASDRPGTDRRDGRPRAGGRGEQRRRPGDAVGRLGANRDETRREARPHARPDRPPVRGQPSPRLAA